MIQASQQISEITRSNIINLFPEYNPLYGYVTEPIESATFRSTVRIGNSLYHSTSEDNKGNYPLDTLGTFWVKGDVSNIYAMLDFENITQTNWEEDGVVEFRRGLMTILALGGLISGCVKVEMLEPKHGVLNGLLLTESSGHFSMSSGEWYADDKYFNQEENWEFENNQLSYDKDNYLYAEVKPTSSIEEGEEIALYGNFLYIADSIAGLISVDATSDNLTEISVKSTLYAQDIDNIVIDDNGIAYVSSGANGTISAVDITNPLDMKEIGTLSPAATPHITSLYIHNNTLLVASATNFATVNITDPTQMAQLDSIVLVADAIGVSKNENYAYTTTQTSNVISSINIANPSSITAGTPLTVSSAAYLKDIRNWVSNAFYVVAFDGTDNGTLGIAEGSPGSLTILEEEYNSDWWGVSRKYANIAWSGGADLLLQSDWSVLYPRSCIGAIYGGEIASNSGGRSIAVNGQKSYVLTPTGIVVIDSTLGQPIEKVDDFPKTAPLVLSVAIGADAPSRPYEKLLVWRVSLDASGNLLSSTDLRESINDDPIDSLTQTKTFYNEGKGAAYFVLPELGDIVRVTFKQANNAGTACGTMVAGKGVDLGQTLSKPSFSQVPALRGYVKEANITTLVDDRDITLVANEANKAIDEWSLFVVDPSENSSYQQILMLAQMKEPSYDITSSTKQHLKLRVQGDELINEIPLGVYDIAYFIAGVTETLEVYKGCGNMSFTRPVTATYIDKYGNTKTAEVDEPRFQDGMLMSGSGEVCWYDAVESIPTFGNGFTFEWEGIADSLSTDNSLKTYIMSNEDVQLYFRNQFLYFYLNGSMIVYALPILNEMMKIEIRAESNGEVKMIIDDTEVASSTMNISDVSSSLTYIGSHNGSANTSGVLLQTASHKWYNTALDNPATLLPISTWVDEDSDIWVAENDNTWVTRT